MSARQVSRTAILVLATASFLGCSRTPNDHGLTSSVSPSATASAAAVPPAEDAVAINVPADTEAWRTGTAYNYRLKLSTKLELAADQTAFDFDLTGDLRVIPGAVTGDGLPLYLTIDNAKILSRVSATQPALEKVATEVSRTGAVITFQSGRAVDLRVAPGLSAIAANIYREVGANLQFSRDHVRRSFTANEHDTTGEYLAEYVQSDTAGLWQKKKTRYLSILGAKPPTDHAPTTPLPKIQGSTIAVQLLPSGRPASVEAANDVLVDGAQAAVRSSTVTSLQSLSETPAPQTGLNWDLLLAKATRVLADQPYGPLASVEAIDDARIHGQTFEQLLGRIAEREGATDLDPASGADPAALSGDSADFIALAALFRRKPETVDLALAKIKSGARGRQTLIDALGSSSSSPAQHALISLVNSEKSDPKVVTRARRALMRVQRPSDETIAAVRDALTKKPFDQSAMYGIGSYARRLRDQGEQAKAKVLGDFLLEQLRAACTEPALLTTLGALTNAGFAEAFDPLREYLSHQSEAVRGAAVRALQSIKNPAVDAVLASTIAKDAASEVKISAMDAAQVREPSDALTDALVAAALSDPEPRVRYRATELMVQWLRRRPELRSALEAVASKDAEPKVRNRAKSAL